ncbi:hypothetical protein SAMN04488498_101271 [Mesorhizobium albiziae]|uniref:Uncharacterized protein n=1 Tax=Neomesorhizobium albiziae TaxID=335020 RepID=A0A1I3V995_9HYPH|nr:hypothetical protein SAMN04488498_101271 [Mesorhizobium albiziae]
MAFPRHARIGGDQIKDGKEFIVIAPGLRRPEQDHALAGNPNNVFFRSNRKAEAHS